jgi:diguanylate cyclase (GGDEF)-like protein
MPASSRTKSPNSPTRRKRAGEKRGVALAVFPSSANTDQHLANLRKTGRFQVSCFPSTRPLSRRTATGYDAVLWELSPDHEPERRTVLATGGVMPIVSYSPDGGDEIAELSRRMGFASHLSAPLSASELDARIAAGARKDLATRLREGQDTLRRRVEQKDALLAMVRATAASLDPSHVSDALLSQVGSWIPAPCWAVVAVTHTADLTTLAEHGLTPNLGPSVYAVARRVIESASELMVGDVNDVIRVPGSAIGAVVALPLKCRGRVIGAVVAFDGMPSLAHPRLPPRVLTALRLLLEVPALALDNALQLKRAEALSVTDDLTHLYNSRYLNQVLRRETKRASRSGRPLSLLFLDLDGFKAINDTYGHLYGSRALVEAAAVIRGSARETDVVARFGGDEFALILPDTGAEGAYAVGARVRERLAAHKFLSHDRLNLHLTASVGVATLPDVAASAEELIKAADRAMYQVKDAGKNGILAATEEVTAGPAEPITPLRGIPPRRQGAAR